MIPPTSIDGTDITGATIDGTDVQEITVDGDTVFTAGPPIIDDFEDGNLSEYSGSTGSYTINGTNVQNGSLALQATGGSLSNIFSFPGDGLPNYPVKGDTIRLFIGGTSDVVFKFCVQPGGIDGYEVVSNLGNNEFLLIDNFNGNNVRFGGASNAIFDFEVVWGQTTLDLTVRDLNGNVVNSGSINHSDSFSSGGILFRARSGATFDHVRIV